MEDREREQALTLKTIDLLLQGELLKFDRVHASNGFFLTHGKNRVTVHWRFSSAYMRENHPDHPEQLVIISAQHLWDEKQDKVAYVGRDDEILFYPTGSNQEERIKATQKYICNSLLQVNPQEEEEPHESMNALLMAALRQYELAKTDHFFTLEGIVFFSSKHRVWVYHSHGHIYVVVDDEDRAFPVGFVEKGSLHFYDSDTDSESALVKLCAYISSRLVSVQHE